MLSEENETESHLQSDPKNPLTTEEDVANEIKEWMITSKTDRHTSPKSYKNAVEHIELKLSRPFSCFEATWTERQYVKTVLELWLEKSLGKAFDYMDDEKIDIREVSNVLSQLDSMDSFEDFYCKFNDVESPRRNWCDGECRYLKLILDQKDIFTSTSRFTNIVDCYFKQFTTSCIEKVFSKYLSDLVKDETNGKKYETFIIDLNDFLAIVNEDKNSLEKMLDPNFLKIYLEDYDNTGQDLIKEIVDMYVTSSKNDFLASVKKEEDLQAFLEKDLEENKVIIENITDTDWQGLFRRLSRNVSSFLTTVGSQRAPGSKPEWFIRYQKASSLMNDVEWTPKLQVLTKETCKRFFLPKTEIKVKEEDGKQIISIKGVAIFVSKMIGEMKRLKDENPHVEEIKIVGLKSVHIDCDLDNETWHGINVGIVTDKLIVDGVINDESSMEISSGVCWNISGKNSEEDDHQPMGEPVQPGESGGNVHVVCNVIINGQKWTIVSDGADGSAAFKWTKENFEELFPSICTSDRERAMNTVLTKLAEILPTENRTKGGNILPGHKGNFLISGTTDDSRNRAGQGGYGGDITIECFGKNEQNSTSEIPFMGEDTRRKSLKAVKMGVYVASGSNGCTGKSTGDIAYIHKIASKSTSKTEGKLYGFEKDQKIEVELDVIKKPRGDQNLFASKSGRCGQEKGNHSSKSRPSPRSNRPTESIDRVHSEDVVRPNGTPFQ
ncbi:hypothetical protein DAPPUDRAFT_252104 [Daphnia pulex]|uniref:Uncharacterized protein n=1 Tax=Daphnia pulex TaxID=6669 RepID=E9H1Z3_DAPPU|nr:hypothetical protein DAPPUDRAFT_252104 [Daphnia pulex]|eukprot:EFX74280.1 hypothetical protein DAPPUDRAFT_252104 [Daphnia pulex]